MGHCHLYPLHSWQDILLTFAEMELDNTTTFPPGTNVIFIRSTEEPVLVQVVGHSEHGDAYRRIIYDRDGKTVLHDRASVRRLSVLQLLCLQMCVYGGGAVPRGGGVIWQPSPRGWWGTVFPGVGNDKWGGGRKNVENGSSRETSVMFCGKMGTRLREKPKKPPFVGLGGVGVCVLSGEMGEIGGKWGKMGENGE